MIVCVCVSWCVWPGLACEGAGVSFERTRVLKTISRFGLVFDNSYLDRPGSQSNLPCAVSPPPLAQR
jgi:hypothetical protein